MAAPTTGDRVREILSSHYPDHIGERLDGRIRERFDIRAIRKARAGPPGV